MTTNETVRGIYTTLGKAVHTGDLDALDEVVTQDAVDHDLPPGYAPGLQGIKRALGEARAACPGLQITVEDVIVDGDRAACRIRSHAAPDGTGRKVTHSGIDIVRISDGKIVERWSRRGAPGLFEQLGLSSLK